MTPAEQIEQHIAAVLQHSPEAINEALDSSVEIDSEHYLTLREYIAKDLLRISRNQHATKDCRARALRCAKQYLGMTQSRNYEEFKS